MGVEHIRAQREQNVSLKRRRVETCEDQAAAFDEAANVLESTMPSVSRYRTDWLAISTRLRRDATALRREADLLRGELEVMLRSLHRAETVVGE